MKVHLDTSGEQLRERITAHFAGPVTFYESGVKARIPDPGSDVVLFGDFLPAAAELVARGCTGIKLWVLCHRAREVLRKFFPLLGERTGVIPREALYEVPEIARSFPLPGEKWEIVFAGRLSPSKNLHLLIHLVSTLQCEFHENVRLILQGSWDNVPNLAPWGEVHEENYEAVLRKEIAGLPWVTPPEIRAPSPVWHDCLSPHSVITSLSSAWAEDFGVAVSEARSLGHCALVSDVGGHADLSGPGVLKIPAHLLWGETFSQFLSVKELSRARARALASWLQSRKEPVHLAPAPRIPAQISSPADEARSLAKLHAKEIHLEREYKFNGHDYWNTEAHLRMWRTYYQHWATSPVQRSTCIFPSGWSLAWPSMKIALVPILRHWLGVQSAEVKVHLITGDSPDLSFLSSLQFRDFVFIGFSQKEHALAGFIRDFRPEVRFIIYALEGPAHFFYPGKVPPLENVLTRRDAFILNCPADSELLRLSFNNAVTALAQYYDQPERSLSWNERSGAVSFFYAGRISPQKGLHFLIAALALLGNESPELHIAGAADEIGVRHLGIDPRDYRNFLIHLAKSLNVDHKVRFLGELPHSEVQRKLSTERVVAVCPSVHADENFGLFAGDALTRGCPAVLTRWGGLNELEKNFPSSVFPVTVQLTEKNIFVSPFQLAEAMKSSLAFSEGEEISSLPQHLPSLPEPDIGELVPTPLQLQLRQRPYPKFKVLDPDLDREVLYEVRRIYGAVPASPKEDLFLAPWCEIVANEVRIRDPLLRSTSILMSSGTERILFRMNGSPFRISEETLSILKGMGQLFSGTMNGKEEV